MTDKVLRIKNVSEKCGISGSMIWHKLNPNSRHYDETFPKPIRLAARAVGWLESELDEWIARRAKHSRYKRNA